MTKIKHTQGEWEAKKETEGIFVKTGIGTNNRAIARVYEFNNINYANEAESNARLIAEAGTVTNECGLTPRQLLEQRDELLGALINLINYAPLTVPRPFSSSYKLAHKSAKKIIAKAKGNNQ